MPVVGESRADVVMGRGYVTPATRQYATAIREMAEDIQHESGSEFFTDMRRIMMDPASVETVKNFFTENSADAEEYTALGNPDGYADHMAMMEAQFDNDRNAFLESSALSAYNPVMGLVFPLHKNLLMNNVFDKGAINKAVAKTPKFTLTMKIRKLVTPEGREIDMFTQQNEMFDAIQSAAPTKNVVVGLPLNPGDDSKQTEIRKAVFGASGLVPNIDNFSIESAVTHVIVSAIPKAGMMKEDTATHQLKPVEQTEITAGTAIEVALPIQECRFDPSYGEIDRQMMTRFSVTYEATAGTPKTLEGILSGFMKDNKFMLYCSDPAVIKVVLSVRRDTSSAMLNTCSVRWDSQTNIVEIPDAFPINTPISPEEVKDIQALYNEDQLTNILSLFKTALGTWKDDKIHKELDNDFKTMPMANKIAEVFDFAPPEGYALDQVEYRHKTFMDALDNYAQTMIQVLNDPNITISVIGNPALIRKITPTTYTYQAPSSIGPVELDFNRTVVTSDKRVYNFVASDKLRNNQNLIILLNPRNSDRVIYCIYDYQLYLSNEIRNAQNYALPAVHAFERFKLVSYQPVQGRVKIINPTGLRTRYENTDPIGRNLMNDYTTYIPDTMTSAGTAGGYPNASAYTKVNDAKKDITAPEKVEYVKP